MDELAVRSYDNTESSSSAWFLSMPDPAAYIGYAVQVAGALLPILSNKR